MFLLRESANLTFQRKKPKKYELNWEDSNLHPSLLKSRKERDLTISGKKTSFKDDANEESKDEQDHQDEFTHS